MNGKDWALIKPPLQNFAVYPEKFGGKYERGAAVPGGNVLRSFALNGANVQFILTGQESGGVALTRDEHDLINHFRNAPLAIKAAVFAALTAGNSVSNSVNVSGNGNRVAGRDYNEKK
ncbi:XRE family transcriptional regulator [Escherichia coli]|nr:XRE family transcriptional regulator [Escherichia coli]